MTHRALVAASIVAPVALLALAGWLNHQQIEAAAIAQGRHTALALGEHAQRTLRAHQIIIDFTDRAVAGWTWPEIRASESLHKQLAQVVAGNPDVASVFLLAPDGRSFLSSRRFPMPLIEAGDREYVQALRAKDELYVSRPLIGRLSDDRFFSVARRRSSPDGSYDGVIGVSVNPVYFESFYATLRESDAAAFALLRTDGVTLAGSAATDGREIASLGAASGHGITRGPDGAPEKLYAFRHVGDYPVIAVFEHPVSAVWAAWRRAMMPYVAACLMAMALLLAGVALFTQRAQRAAAEARSHEAETANRAKDAFIAALSHELRNPLAAISNAADVLERNPASTSAVAIIGRQIRHLRSVLEDLLDTARAVHGKLNLDVQRVDVHPLAQAAIAEQLHGRAVAATLDAPPSILVDGDAVRIKQMLDNLIENAIKYGGRNIEVKLVPHGDWVTITVADDGDGIEPALLPRLFEPFVQGRQRPDRVPGGLGLGLALVQRLAELHGGTLSVHSDGPGRGSKFSVRLPKADAEPATSTPGVESPVAQR